MKSRKLKGIAWIVLLAATIFICEVSYNLLRLTNSYLLFEHGDVQIKLRDLIPFAAHLDTPSSYESCVAKLRKIEMAKASLALEKNLKDGSIVTWKEIQTGLNDHKFWCPQGGVYRLGTIGERARCSIRPHNVP